MNPFGTRLRQLRQLSLTEKGEKITQQRLGDSLGQKLGSNSFSNATVSNWENGQTSINKDDRLILLALIKIFIEFNTLKSIKECNEFLLVGNFRALNEDEICQLRFVESKQITSKQSDSIVQKNSTFSENIWPYIFSKNPYHRLPSRKSLMDNLVELLLDPDGEKVINICGIGGIGKTAFALEIARRAIEQGDYSGLFGDCASDRIIVGDEILPVRNKQYNSTDLWNSLARQFNRIDLIGKNKYFTARELLSQSKNEHYIFLFDSIECMENFQTVYIASKINLGNHRVILTSRMEKSPPSCKDVQLTSLPVEDSLLFLEKEAMISGRRNYLPFLRKKIDYIMDVSGGIPIIMQFILDKITSFDLDHILENIKNGVSPFFDFIYSKEWQQLDEPCQKYLLNKAKELQGKKYNSYLYRLNNDSSQTELKYPMQAYSFGFIERHEIDGKYQNCFNSFFRHFLCCQAKEELSQLSLDGHQYNSIKPLTSTSEEEKHFSESLWPFGLSKNPYYSLPSRAALMNELVDLLAGSNANRIVNINGIGGIGKTAFALEIARRLISQRICSRLIGDLVNDQFIIDDEVLQLRSGDYSFSDFWNSIAIQLSRKDLVDKNIYIVMREFFSNFHDEKIICLADGIERMVNYQVFYIADKIDLGNNKLIITSRINKIQKEFINVSLTSLPMKDTMIFLKKEAVLSKRENYLSLFIKNIDSIMDASGGIPIILHYIVEKITTHDLDTILEKLTNGDSPFFNFVYGNKWRQLDEPYRKFLINKAKESKRQNEGSFLYKLNSAPDQTELKYLMQAYSLGFLERHEIDGKYQYSFNSFTRHFLSFKEKSYS